MKSISSFEWTIALLAYLIAYSAAGLPRAQSMAHRKVQFGLSDVSSDFFFLLIRNLIVMFCMFYSFFCVVKMCETFLILSWWAEWHFCISATQSITIGVAFVPRSTINFQFSALLGRMLGHSCSRVCDQYFWEKGCLSGSIGGYVRQMMRKYDLYFVPVGRVSFTWCLDCSIWIIRQCLWEDKCPSTWNILTFPNISVA